MAPIIDADVDGPTPYIVTRYVPGPSLDDFVAERGLLPPAELHRVASGLAEALDAIHSAGVVHRDVKPANVLLVDGDPVLIDFGIAHVADDIRLTLTGLVMGTPGYLAPEVVAGEDVTPATDWWGWAATTAFAASGTPPFGTGRDERRARAGRQWRAGPRRGRPPHRAAALRRALTRPRATARTTVRSSPRSSATPTEHRSPTPSRCAGSARRLRCWRPPRPRRCRWRHPPGSPVRARWWAAPRVRPAPWPPARGDSRHGRGMPFRRLPSPGSPVRGRRSPRPSRRHRHPRRRLDPPVRPGGSRPGRSTEGWLRTCCRLRPRRFPSRSRTGTRLASATAPTATPGSDEPPASGTLLALLALLAALTASAPLVAALPLLGWITLARTADRSVTSLVMRRHERGVRGSDVAVAVASSPWHLVVGFVGGVRHGRAAAARGRLRDVRECPGAHRADRLGRACRRRRAPRLRRRVRRAHGVVGPGWREPAPGEPQHRARGHPWADGAAGGGRGILLVGAAVLLAMSVAGDGPSWWPRAEAPAGSTTSCPHRDPPVAPPQVSADRG